MFKITKYNICNYEYLTPLQYFYDIIHKTTFQELEKI